MADATTPPDEKDADAFTGSGREGESPFARDADDVLIRKERETLDKFREVVTVVIDGFPVTVKKAVQRTDPRGNVVRDAAGEPELRTTTIYDAARELFTPAPGNAFADGELARRIPVLCHQSHQHPVAVCRMCSVHIVKPSKGRPERKLFPACQHPVEDGMLVTTRCGGAEYNPAAEDPKPRESAAKYAPDVAKSVGLLAELLMADQPPRPLTPAAAPAGPGHADARYRNELAEVAAVVKLPGRRPVIPPPPRRTLPQADDAGNRMRPVRDRNALAADYPRARRLELPVVAPPVEPERVPGAADREAWLAWNENVDEAFPYSSRTVVVDHDRCILCDRCVRACSEDKPFKIIGRTGKGYNTRIGFDLDQLMGESDCVQCGQCMTYCPTGALSLRRRVQPRAWGEHSPEQIPQNPTTPFPPAPAPDKKGTAAFLTADEMLAVRLEYRDPATGRTATFRPFEGIPYTFLKWNEGAVRKRTIPAGVTGVVLCEADTYGTTAFLLEEGGDGAFVFRPQVNAPAGEPRGFFDRLRGGGGKPRFGPVEEQHERSHLDLILGEMACLTAARRTGRIEANGPAAWYEVTRNVLDMIQRTGAAQQLLDRIYTGNAIWACLAQNKLFKTGLKDQAREAARDFLAGVNRPDEWVGARTGGAVRRLWDEYLTPGRVQVGDPVTALGYHDREALARLAETDPGALGVPDADARAAAKQVRERKLTEFLRRLSTPAAYLRVVRELAGADAADRWFGGADAADPRPRRLLEFLLVPPATGLRHGPPPAGLERAALELLLRLNPVQLLRVDPGQAIVKQDDTASDFYMIRLGFVRVQVESGGVSVTVGQSGQNESFGEVALLDRLPRIEAAFGPPAGGSGGPRKRSASVVALDPVEVVRIRGPVFHLLCAHVPGLETVLLDKVEGLLAQTRPRVGRPGVAAAPAAAKARGERLEEYLQLGLYQSQKMLVLDLTSCTRCDECTRACADSHAHLDRDAGLDPTMKHARLLREGMRFGDFLVATSCRSCHQPYCMDGCPVDAIHRQGTDLQVVVEDHCIGCGLCERNCPYGSIHMVAKAAGGGERVAKPPRRAVNCDLCGPVGGDPYCVAACPHETAFRWSGEKLFDEVLARLSTPAARR